MPDSRPTRAQSREVCHAAATILAALAKLPDRQFAAVADTAAELRRLIRRSGGQASAPGHRALWHRSRQNLPPRPVLVIKALGKKVRVLDLVDGDAHNLIFRDVFPHNLTEG